MTAIRSSQRLARLLLAWALLAVAVAVAAAPGHWLAYTLHAEQPLRTKQSVRAGTAEGPLLAIALVLGLTGAKDESAYETGKVEKTRDAPHEVAG